MRKAEGVGMLILPDQPTREFRTFTCSHCGMPKRATTLRCDGVEEDGRHWCDSCDAMVCNACANDQRCVPFERKMEAAEAKARFWADVGGKR